MATDWNKVRERLRSRTAVMPNGCWEWTGRLDEHRYGRMSVGNKKRGVHRLAYEAFVGAIPDGYTIDHLCHTRDTTCPTGNACRHRRCINPDHLEPVTQGENTRRSPALNRTHCQRGHPFDVQNTLVRKNGSRMCRRCNNASTVRNRRLRRQRNTTT